MRVTRDRSVGLLDPRIARLRGNQRARKWHDDCSTRSMMNPSFAVGLSAVLAVVACSGAIDAGSVDGGPAADHSDGREGGAQTMACVSAPGSGTVIGSVDGVGLNVVSVTAVSVGGSELEIFLTDIAGGCEVYGRGRSYAGHETETSLNLFVGSAVGSYAVMGTGGLPAGFEKSDFTRNMFVINTGGVAGTVTVTSITACELSGSFDVTFLKGGPLRGTFKSPICPLPDAGPPGLSDSGVTNDS